MKRSKTIWIVITVILGLASMVGGTASWLEAQVPNASVLGTVLDQSGKPFPDVTLIFVNDQGTKYEVKTDKDGKYNSRNMRPGVYILTVKVKDQKVWETNVRAEGGTPTQRDINFKELVAQQGTAAQEAVKKQEEEKQKFEGMKTHFNAGVAALDQVKVDREALRTASADQRDAKKQQLSTDADKAVTEFQAAQKAAAEKDSNLHLIYAKLGEAYDAAGKNDEAAEAYRKAIATKPDVAGYYNNLGNVLARQGKLEETKQAYSKAAELDPPGAAGYWRNMGIVLYNAGKMKEALDPLKKATEIDPKSAQTWYLLGAAMVGAMDYKTEKEKIIPVILPGTLEAYEKAIELDPSGPYGAQAKQGLESLKAMGVEGIGTRVGAARKKK
jgi:tetratricopeptide (TPR) repeat protein